MKENLGQNVYGYIVGLRLTLTIIEYVWINVHLSMYLSIHLSIYTYLYNSKNRLILDDWKTHMDMWRSVVIIIASI